MIRHFGVVLSLVALEFCLGCDRQINVPPMRRYAEKLVSTSGAKLTVGRCEMFKRSRKGFCILEGSGNDIRTFTSRLKLASKPGGPAYDDLSCLSLSDFGERVETAPISEKALTAKAGIGRFSPTGLLPPNADNVRLVSVYAGTTSICVEMEYPYG